jgi:hypothetical protein
VIVLVVDFVESASATATTVTPPILDVMTITEGEQVTLTEVIVDVAGGLTMTALPPQPKMSAKIPAANSREANRGTKCKDLLSRAILAIRQSLTDFRKLGYTLSG